MLDRHRLWGAALATALVASPAVADTPRLEPHSNRAFSVNQRLGRGVNIIGYDPIWQDRAKGRFKEGTFAKIREAGFTAVRVNLHPFKHMDAANGFALKPSWLDTLDWAVKGALAARLAVILDMHEFHAMAEDPAGRKEAWLSFWRQVAPRFKDAPDDVVFELLNEPFGKLTPELWNEYLKEGLAVVRATNPTRAVIVGGGSWNSIDGLQTLVLPENDRNLIATVHYYTPMEFTHQGAPWTPEFAGQDRGHLDRDRPGAAADRARLRPGTAVGGGPRPSGPPRRVRGLRQGRHGLARAVHGRRRADRRAARLELGLLAVRQRLRGLRHRQGRLGRAAQEGPRSLRISLRSTNRHVA